MNSSEIRKKFWEFFEKKGHKIVPSSSLLPTDPSVLFTTAGMQQFKPYYLGKESPFGKNVASCQKCIRTSDIEEVGDERHLTFFEMLGNFSFGGYFKEKSIELAFEFITKEMGLEIDYVTIFSPEKVAENDWRKNVPEDKESFKIWEKIGIAKEKIRKEGIDNFWGPTGQEGPCGPTTEVYIKRIEIWNIVFNEYFCDKDKNLKKLKQAGVDTGMGLERLAMVVQKKENVFEIDLFLPILRDRGGTGEGQSLKAERIIADHIKSSVFLISDGVLPSNIEQGYVLRRLLRRAIRYGKLLDLPGSFLIPLAEKAIEIYKDNYPELEQKQAEILIVIQKEAQKFEKTLDEGLKNLKFQILNLKTKNQKIFPRKVAFDLYQSYGFPLELTKEIVKEELFEIDEKDFEEELKKHQEISRAGAEKKFGGLGKEAENYKAVKLHTATHLLHQALREVLGKNVRQMGSDINSERLRFDFSYPQKMTEEQIRKTEDIVNWAISRDFEVKCEEMTLKEAEEKGVIGFFKEKYGERVRVYSIGQYAGYRVVDEFSVEICGGPHVKRTSELGKFKILREENPGEGARRIKAILLP